MSECLLGSDDVESVLRTHGWGSSFPRHSRREVSDAVLALLAAAVPQIKAEAVAEYKRYLAGEEAEGWR